MTASLPPQGENSPKDSRIEPLNVPQKETPHPGPLPLGRGEGESSTVHLRREVHGEGGPQVRPALPKTRVLGEEGRGKGARCDQAATDLLILSDGTIFVHNLTPAMAAILNEINPHDASIQPRAFVTPR